MAAVVRNVRRLVLVLLVLVVVAQFIRPAKTNPQILTCNAPEVAWK